MRLQQVVGQASAEAEHFLIPPPPHRPARPAGYAVPTAIAVAIGIVLASELRYALIDYRSGDFNFFFNRWYEFILSKGGFAALKHDFTNYMPTYEYLMVLASFSGLPNIVAIKLISITFDFICAFFVYKIVQLKYPGTYRDVAAGLLTLFAPTLVLNGSVWGQTDVIYTTCLIACLYFLLRGKETAAFAAYGLAFTFKLQATWFAPLLAVLFVRKAVSWKSFFIIPLVCLIIITPAWLIGRPLDELLLIYAKQPEVFHHLNLGAPNLYLWIPNADYHIFVPLGIAWTVLLVGAAIAVAYKSREKITADALLLLATLFTIAVPWLLPKMHDRFFFSADIISIVLAFYLPRYFYVPIVVTSASLFAYHTYLTGAELFDGSRKIGSLALLVVMVVLSYRLFRVFYPPPPPAGDEGGQLEMPMAVGGDSPRSPVVDESG